MTSLVKQSLIIARLKKKQKNKNSKNHSYLKTNSLANIGLYIASIRKKFHLFLTDKR